MKHLFALLAVFLLASPVWGGETVEYYKQLGYTIAFPHYYEGLWPLLDPRGESHYIYATNEKKRPIRISFFDEKGRPAHNKHGWHTLRFQYDSRGRLVEASFFSVDGKMADNKDFGFAVEKRVYPTDKKDVFESSFYDARGRGLSRGAQKGLKGRFKTLLP